MRDTVILLSFVMLRSLSRDTVEELEENARLPCGVKAVFVAARILDIDIDLDRVVRLLPEGAGRRHSLAELSDAAQHLGMHPVAVRLTAQQLSRVPVPSILHVKQRPEDSRCDHFMLFLGRTNDGRIVALDPLEVPRGMTGQQFESVWQGTVLALCTNKGEAERLRAYASQSTLSQSLAQSETTIFFLALAGTLGWLAWLSKRFLMRHSHAK